MAAGMTVLASEETVTDDSGMCRDNVTYTFDAKTGELIMSGTGSMKNYQFAHLNTPPGCPIKSLLKR